MSTEVVMLLGHSSKSLQADQVLRQAMERRGWEYVSHGRYRIAIEDALDDAEIVEIAERDVKQSIYVAGIPDYEAYCLLRDDPFSLGKSGGLPGRKENG